MSAGKVEHRSDARVPPEGSRWGPISVLEPGWPLPSSVRAAVTLRQGGVSSGRYGLGDGRRGGLNLGDHCGDDPVAVAENRRRLSGCLPAEPRWLEQVHGVDVVRWDADSAFGVPPRADAAVTPCPGLVLAVLTADCLPVFVTDTEGRAVALAHAGWRGLAGGVIERCVAALEHELPEGAECVAWLGPAIGPTAFEVGDDVRAACLAGDGDAGGAFVPAGRPGKWFADLYDLARRRLRRAGVERIGGEVNCTVADRDRFYSFRRDGQTGRMVSLIWRAF